MNDCNSEIEHGLSDQSTDNHRNSDRSKVVLLIGSTQFGDSYRKAHRILSAKGYIVIRSGILSKSDNTTLSSKTLKALTRACRDAMYIADIIYVVNPYGYIGQETIGEIVTAGIKDNGCCKRIEYMYPTKTDPRQHVISYKLFEGLFFDASCKSKISANVACKITQQILTAISDQDNIDDIVGVLCQSDASETPEVIIVRDSDTLGSLECKVSRAESEDVVIGFIENGKVLKLSNVLNMGLTVSSNIAYAIRSNKTFKVIDEYYHDDSDVHTF